MPEGDPIVEEIRRLRRVHAARCGNDIDRIVADWQRREREAGRKLVIRPSRKPVQPTSAARE